MSALITSDVLFCIHQINRVNSHTKIIVESITITIKQKNHLNSPTQLHKNLAQKSHWHKHRKWIELNTTTEHVLLVPVLTHGNQQGSIKQHTLTADWSGASKQQVHSVCHHSQCDQCVWCQQPNRLGHNSPHQHCHCYCKSANMSYYHAEQNITASMPWAVKEKTQKNEKESAISQDADTKQLFTTNYHTNTSYQAMTDIRSDYTYETQLLPLDINDHSWIAHLVQYVHPDTELQQRYGCKTLYKQ